MSTILDTNVKHASRFKPAWWCPGAHLQTAWQTLMRRRPAVALTRERLELADGDFLDLDWADTTNNGPIVLMLHGLAGSAQSKYALGIAQEMIKHGFRPVLLNFRGCSGEPNRLPRGYHAGETDDLAYVIHRLRVREPDAPLGAIGFSLGANALLKYLGTTTQNELAAAVAVSTPFVLAECAKRLNTGFSRLFQRYLLWQLRRTLTKKRLSVPFLPTVDFHHLRTLRQLDEHVTAPLHGFANADEFYAAASSLQYLRNIRAPTLIIQSRDDPFLTERGLPTAEQLSPTIEFEVYDHGGHVGFVAGRLPWRTEYWLEQRIPAFLSEQLKAF